LIKEAGRSAPSCNWLVGRELPSWHEQGEDTEEVRMDPALVTGGTGTLGRHVVRRLRNAGRAVRVLTRRSRNDEDGVRFVTGDLLSGEDFDAAVDGVATIIHCAGSNKGDEVATQNLVNAAARTSRPHLVYISVVGAERMPVSGLIDRTMFSYFDMKRKGEQVVAGSGLPWTTMRATQFHDLILRVLEKLAKLPVVTVPSGVSFQPVDADEVAARLVELALGQQSGLVPDIAGPRVYGTADLVRGYLEATHRRRLLLPIRLPGRAARALRAGANLTPERAVGTRTWEAFLTDHLSRSTQVR
jgi:uncharacterized protein YbjT (DUF2867 family)